MQGNITQLAADTAATQTNGSTTTQVTTDDDRKKKSEQEIAEQATRLAAKYVRIAGTWYKRCFHPTMSMEVLERIKTDDIIMDYGKKLGGAILRCATKCINSISIPDHINYQEFIKTQSGDFYYNTYRPIPYKPQAGGDFPHIRQLVEHIFGEQVEMGWDYLQLLYYRPQLKLPALLFVSRQTGTGKSTFCFFLAELFGENVVQITPDTFRSKFASTWLDKLLVYCEETCLKKPEDYEKAKNLVTASQTPSEAKGKDWRPVSIYLKFIFCSNDEDCPILLDDQDSRFWVRKVPPLAKTSDDVPKREFLDKCTKEIPFFLDWLQHRQLTTAGTDRLWFTPEETRTDAWRRIVAGSRDKVEQELIFHLLEVMTQTQTTKLKYDGTSLFQFIKQAGIGKYLRESISAVDVRRIIHRWGLKAVQRTARFQYFLLNDAGGILQFEKVGRPVTISKEFLENLQAITKINKR